MSTTRPGRATFLRRALHKRCPQCGQGELFASFARLRERCSICAHVFRREPGSQTGAMYCCAIVTELFAMAIALGLFFFTEWSKPVALTVGALVVVAFSFVMLPIAMALWCAVEYSTDVANRERWVDPRP